MKSSCSHNAAMPLSSSSSTSTSSCSSPSSLDQASSASRKRTRQSLNNDAGTPKRRKVGVSPETVGDFKQFIVQPNGYSTFTLHNYIQGDSLATQWVDNAKQALFELYTQQSEYFHYDNTSKLLENRMMQVIALLPADCLVKKTFQLNERQRSIMDVFCWKATLTLMGKVISHLEENEVQVSASEQSEWLHFSMSNYFGLDIVELLQNNYSQLESQISVTPLAHPIWFLMNELSSNQVRDRLFANNFENIMRIIKRFDSSQLLLSQCCPKDSRLTNSQSQGGAQAAPITVVSSSLVPGTPIWECVDSQFGQQNERYTALYALFIMNRSLFEEVLHYSAAQCDIEDCLNETVSLVPIRCEDEKQELMLFLKKVGQYVSRYETVHSMIRALSYKQYPSILATDSRIEKQQAMFKLLGIEQAQKMFSIYPNEFRAFWAEACGIKNPLGPSVYQIKQFSAWVYQQGDYRLTSLTIAGITPELLGINKMIKQQFHVANLKINEFNWLKSNIITPGSMFGFDCLVQDPSSNSLLVRFCVPPQFNVGASMKCFPITALSDEIDNFTRSMEAYLHQVQQGQTLVVRNYLTKYVKLQSNQIHKKKSFTISHNDVVYRFAKGARFNAAENSWSGRVFCPFRRQYFKMSGKILFSQNRGFMEEIVDRIYEAFIDALLALPILKKYNAVCVKQAGSSVLKFKMDGWLRVVVYQADVTSHGIKCHISLLDKEKKLTSYKSNKLNQKKLKFRERLWSEIDRCYHHVDKIEIINTHEDASIECKRRDATLCFKIFNDKCISLNNDLVPLLNEISSGQSNQSEINSASATLSSSECYLFSNFFNIKSIQYDQKNNKMVVRLLLWDQYSIVLNNERDVELFKKLSEAADLCSYEQWRGEKPIGLREKNVSNPYKIEEISINDEVSSIEFRLQCLKTKQMKKTGLNDFISHRKEYQSFSQAIKQKNKQFTFKIPSHYVTLETVDVNHEVMLLQCTHIVKKEDYHNYCSCLNCGYIDDQAILYKITSDLLSGHKILQVNYQDNSSPSVTIQQPNYSVDSSGAIVIDGDDCSHSVNNPTVVATADNQIPGSTLMVNGLFAISNNQIEQGGGSLLDDILGSGLNNQTEQEEGSSLDDILGPGF